jgi:hypothetical protein
VGKLKFPKISIAIYKTFTVLLQIAILTNFEIPFSSCSYLVFALSPVAATNWRRSSTVVTK